VCASEWRTSPPQHTNCCCASSTSSGEHSTLWQNWFVSCRCVCVCVLHSMCISDYLYFIYLVFVRACMCMCVFVYLRPCGISISVFGGVRGARVRMYINMCSSHSYVLRCICVSLGLVQLQGQANKYDTHCTRDKTGQSEQDRGLITTKHTKAIHTAREQARENEQQGRPKNKCNTHCTSEGREKRAGREG